VTNCHTRLLQQQQQQQQQQQEEEEGLWQIGPRMLNSSSSTSTSSSSSTSSRAQLWSPSLLWTLLAPTS
jgi:hypothetical protein